MFCGDIMNGEKVVSQAIMKHGYIYNNVNPGEINWKSIHTKTPSGILLPSTLFLGNLAIDKEPDWVQTIHFCVNLWNTAYRYGHFTHHSEHMRSWMRNHAVVEKMGLLPKKKLNLVYGAMDMYNRKLWDKSKGPYVYFLDFVNGHPIREAASILRPLEITGHDENPLD